MDEDSVAPNERTRYWLRFNDHDVELPVGETLIGRSERCQLVVDDPLVSRRHAVFIVDSDEVRIQDLGSVNGVLVNGERVTGFLTLKSGDRVSVGRQEMELHSVGGQGREREPTHRKRMMARTLSGLTLPKPGGGFDDAEATRQGNVLDMLGGVADKVLALGRGKEAERILRKPLEGVMSKVERGHLVEDDLAERAASFAVRLAQSTSEGVWIDYVFRLYAARKRVLPASIVDVLYSSIRTVPGVTIGTLRAYLDVLSQLEPQLGPAERFLVRRIEGLEGLAAAG